MSSVIALPTIKLIHAQSELEKLWLEHRQLAIDHAAMTRAITEAVATMPRWAQPGPEYIDHRGARVGNIVDIPEVENLPTLPCEGAQHRVRFAHYHLRDELENRLKTFDGRGPEWPTFRKRWLIRCRVVRQREADQLQEQERAGLTDLWYEENEINAKLYDVRDAIRKLNPTVDTIAAVGLLNTTYWYEPNNVHRSKQSIMLLRHLQAAISVPSIKADVEMYLYQGQPNPPAPAVAPQVAA